MPITSRETSGHRRGVREGAETRGYRDKTRLKRRRSLSVATPHPHSSPVRSPSALLALRLSHHRASYREGTCEHTKNRAAGKGRAREKERATTLQLCGAEKPPSLQRRERGARPLLPHLGALGQGRRRQSSTDGLAVWVFLRVA